MTAAERDNPEEDAREDAGSVSIRNRSSINSPLTTDLQSHSDDDVFSSVNKTP